MGNNLDSQDSILILVLLVLPEKVLCKEAAPFFLQKPVQFIRFYQPHRHIERNESGTTPKKSNPRSTPPSLEERPRKARPRAAWGSCLARRLTSLQA